MWRFLLIALVALLFGLAMFAINHEPLNSPLTWILAPLAGAAALGFLIRMFGYPRGGHGGFIRILTPRTNGEHPLAQRRRRPAAKLLAKDEARRIAANIAKLPELEQKCLIAALQFFGRITVSVHNALNRVIASRTGKNL